MISDAGHRVRRLPPYSPFLNPIEEVFAQCKNSVPRKQTHSNEALQAAMDESADEITPDNLLAYYNHTVDFLVPCISRNDIF